MAKRKLKDIDIPDEIVEWELEGLILPSGVTPMDHYINCISNGSSPKFALQLVSYAFRKSTLGIGLTEAVRDQDQNRHGRTLLEQFKGNAKMLARLVRRAKKQGYNPKYTSRYNPIGCEFPGDKVGFMSNDERKAEFKRRGLKIVGEEILPIDPKPQKPVHKLHPRLQRELIKKKIQENPDLARKSSRELREMVVSEHGSKGD